MGTVAVRGKNCLIIAKSLFARCPNFPGGIQTLSKFGHRLKRTKYISGQSCVHTIFYCVLLEF